MTLHTLSVVMATLSVALIVAGVASIARHFKTNGHGRQYKHAH